MTFETDGASEKPMNNTSRECSTRRSLNNEPNDWGVCEREFSEGVWLGAATRSQKTSDDSIKHPLEDLVEFLCLQVGVSFSRCSSSAAVSCSKSCTTSTPFQPLRKISSPASP